MREERICIDIPCISTRVDPCEWFSEGITLFLSQCSLAAEAVIESHGQCVAGVKREGICSSRGRGKEEDSNDRSVRATRIRLGWI